MKIQKATKKDFKEYYYMNNEMLKEYSETIRKKIQILGEKKSGKIFKKIISNKKSCLLLAKEREACGYLYGTIFENPFNTGGYIEDIMVLKKYRKKKIGRKLIKEFANILKKRKLNKILLSVNIKNKKAFNLYKNTG